MSAIQAQRNMPLASRSAPSDPVPTLRSWPIDHLVVSTRYPSTASTAWRHRGLGVIERAAFIHRTLDELVVAADAAPLSAATTPPTAEVTNLGPGTTADVANPVAQEVRIDISGSRALSESVEIAYTTASSDASTEPHQATWHSAVLKRLSHLRKLEDGWDGAGSVRVDLDAIRKAWRILVAVTRAETRPPSIAPGRDGNLQIAWYARDIELEIDVPSHGEPSVSLYDRNTGEERDVTFGSPDLSAAFEQLAG